MYHVLNDCNFVNVKIIMMEHLWWGCVVVLIQKRLLLNTHIGNFSVVTPSLCVCLDLICYFINSAYNLYVVVD